MLLVWLRVCLFACLIVSMFACLSVCLFCLLNICEFTVFDSKHVCLLIGWLLVIVIVPISKVKGSLYHQTKEYTMIRKTGNPDPNGHRFA